ncbi:ATP-binding cassette, subfamily B [Cohnella sp. OV330]|uniref:ABC transporter ATP-binding protein n=1 Tax=Cohnella sp. OV330 TaxID=1855288 RepID=UPI0008EDC70B|nr:ABC transporter ATP-binding protein [Cohnella sp. OV330]SFB46959.1 ATP-binding cassette, subfamily B [Cohnella sp. OV330]
MRRLSENHQAGAKLSDVKLSRVLMLFRPYVGQLTFILLLSLAATLAGLAAPLATKELVDQAIPQKDAGLLLLFAGLMAASPLAKGVLNVWQTHLNNKVGQSVMRDLNDRLFRNLQRQSMSFFTRSRTGEIVQRISGDVQAVQGAITGTIVTAITQAVTLVATVVILLRLDWRLALVSMVVIPVLLLPARRIGALRKSLRLRVQTLRGEMSSHLSETFGVSGALLTRIYGREEAQVRKFGEMNDTVKSMELRLGLIGRWYGMAAGVSNPVATAIVYLYGGWLVIHGGLSIGSVIAFAALTGRMYEPVSGLLGMHLDLSAAMGIFQRIFEYLDLKPEVADEPDAQPLQRGSGLVSFEGVSFAYASGGAAVLKEIDLTARPGQLLALVGPSGAGKTTLAGLVGRLYDPTRGTVRIDGRDVRGVTLASLREQIGYVTQEPFLFYGTIADNLRFAKEDATIEEMESACRQAYIHDVIAGLPQGYDTKVGERGHRLSGGERQRIAIARAILKNPRILVLDEATSHLDSRSEAYVQEALDSLMAGRTTIAIAHRLSTVRAADTIAVMDRGRIVELGTHEELLERDGLYAKLYRTQFAETPAGAAE